MASNLDYSDFDTFVPLTVKGIFKSRERIEYEANLILGFFGFTRVFKRLDDGSILQMSLNERMSRESKLDHFLDQIIEKTNVNVIGHFRQTFWRSKSFKELKDAMLRVEGLGLGAASYIIMNSETEGLVAELEPNSVTSVYPLGSASTDDWYLV